MKAFRVLTRLPTLIVGVLLLSGWGMAHITSAQSAPSETAGVLHILYAQVEFLRLNTLNWMAVPAESILPIGTGDAARTDREGRLLIEYGNSSAYLLSNSQIEITAEADTRLTLHLTSGRLLVQAMDDQPAQITVVTDRMQVDAPSPAYGVQVMPEADSLISTSGTVNASANRTGFTVESGYGVRVRDQIDPPVDLGGQNNFARIDALLDGCPATIEARGEASLNVRVGPSLAYDTLGSIANGTPVYLMAVSPGGERYRVQFLNGFGWVLANGVRHRCLDLPVLPYSAVESIVRVFYASAEEITLLRPYFGSPDDDPILYILPETQTP